MRCRSHDWAVSLEVAEHIPRAAEATYLTNLNCSAARYPIIGVELAFPEEDE